MGRVWNELDERAFVPTPDMLNARDVLPGTPVGVAASRSPFSLGVYSVGYAREDPMRLYYVSEAVAKDRSKTLPRLESGWYLCVEDDPTEFELRITTRISKLQTSFDRELPGGDVAQVSLRVDGEGCGESWVMQRVPTTMLDIVSKGFMESTLGDQFRGETNCRAYTFAKKIHSGLETFAHITHGSDFGTIELQIQRGKLGAALPNAPNAFTGKVGKMKATSGRAAVKNGQCVGVSRSGRKISVPSTSFSHEVTSLEYMEHLGIRIFVRERNWLMSRRIITSTGEPCSEKMANSILAAASVLLEKRRPSHATTVLTSQKLGPGVAFETSILGDDVAGRCPDDP